MLKGNKRVVLLLVLLGMLIFGVPGYAKTAPQNFKESNDPGIRVGIWSNQTSVIVSASTDFNIVEGNTDQILGMFPGKQKVGISIKDNSIFINGFSDKIKEYKYSSRNG